MVQAVSFEKKKLMLKTKLPLRANMILILFIKRMMWQLMWHNVRVAELNATLQLLVIY